MQVSAVLLKTTSRSTALHHLEISAMKGYSIFRQRMRKCTTAGFLAASWSITPLRLTPEPGFRRTALLRVE